MNDSFFIEIAIIAFLGFIVHLIVTRVWISHAVIQVSQQDTARIRDRQQRINRSVETLLSNTKDAVFREQRLREAIQWYELLATHLPSMSVLVFDTHQRYVLALGQSLKDSGYNPDDMIGRSLSEIVTQSERLEHIRGFYNRVLAGEIVREDGYQALSGKRFDITFVPLRNDNGAIVGGMAVSVERDDIQ